MRDISRWVESAAGRLAAADLAIELVSADLMRLLRDGPWAWEAVEHRITKAVHTLNEHRANIDTQRVALDQMHLEGMRGDGKQLGYTPVYQGVTWRDPDAPEPHRVYAHTVSDPENCPLRDIEVTLIELLADGMTVEEAAEATHSSYQTTRSRIGSAKNKAQCTSGQTTELVAIAMRRGWIH